MGTGHYPLLFRNLSHPWGCFALAGQAIYIPWKLGPQDSCIQNIWCHQAGPGTVQGLQWAPTRVICHLGAGGRSCQMDPIL